jgi:Na+-transporting methylmalonyl-CoA/oxaloacetate decarboxylase gamma subunit
MKKFLVLTSLVFLLSGCGKFIDEVEKGVKEAEEQQEPKQKVADIKAKLKKEVVVTTVSLKDDKYYDYITGKLDSLKANQAIIIDVFNNGSSKENPMEKMALATIDNIKIAKKIQSAIVPSKYEGTHQYFVRATDNYLIYLETIRKGLLVNEINVEDVFDEYNTANDLFMKGTTMLNNLHPTVVGDGTITTQDIKDLDKLAGIDHDSVVMNISYDGKELIGKWLYADNTVAIILNADGSYEGYGKGQYPIKDNAMLGTWEYDYAKNQLIIENKKVYKNGKNVLVSRAKQEMPLTYFKENTLRMTDTQTLADFSFVKQ